MVQPIYKKKSFERIPTGLPELDKLLNGGFPKGFVLLCKGKAGTGKTLFLRKFLAQGCNSDEVGIYILPFKDPSVCLEIMELYNWKINTKNLLFFVYQGVLSENKPFIKGNFNSLSDLSLEVNTLIKKLKGKKVRIIIESFSNFFVSNPSQRVLDFLHSLLLAIRESNLTLALEVQEDAHSTETIALLESLTDGTIDFRLEGGKRFMMVKRLKEMPLDLKWIEFNIEENEGIKIVEFFK